MGESVPKLTLQQELAQMKIDATADRKAAAKNVQQVARERDRLLRQTTEALAKAEKKRGLGEILAQSAGKLLGARAREAGARSKLETIAGPNNKG